ncbi:heat-shock protein Hsp90 [bacterium]|nr:heat-shock protein Hsp90 [bacterium]
MEAPSCCAELKACCKNYMEALDTDKEKEAAKALTAELEADVMPIEAVIGFFRSDAGKAKFGEEMADKIASHAESVKAGGGVWCDCPACAPGRAILDHKDVIL